MPSIFAGVSGLHSTELLKNSQNEQWLLKRYSRLTQKANFWLFGYGALCGILSGYQFVFAGSLAFFDLLFLLVFPAVPFLAFYALKGQPCVPKLQFTLVALFSVTLQEQIRGLALSEQLTLILRLVDVIILMEFVVRPYPAHYMNVYLSHVGYFLVSSLLHSASPTKVLPLLTEGFLELLVSNIVEQDILARDHADAYRKLWAHERRRKKCWKRLVKEAPSSLMLVFCEDKVLFANSEFTLQFGDIEKPTVEIRKIMGQLKCSSSCDEITLWNRVSAYLKEEGGDKAIKDIGEFIYKPRPQEDSWKYFVAKAGHIVWKKQNACLLNMLEITSHKKAQTELISRHYRNILLTTASHELMTPLNGILGGVQLIEDNKDPEKVKQYFSILTCSCKFLINITEDMHDYCLYESGSLVLTKEIIDLKDLMKEALGMVEVQTRQRGVEVRLVYDENIPEPIYTDKKRLMQVFLNLLANAAKYTFKGAITFSAKCNDPLVTIEIADTGIGISENKQKSLFKLFAAAADNESSGPRSYAGAGSGLGLTVSQALTKLLGTGLSFSTKEGEGTTFTFSLFKELPRKRSESVRNSLHSPPTLRSMRKRATIYVPQLKKTKSRILPPTKDTSGISPRGGMRRNRTEGTDFAGAKLTLRSRKSSVSSGEGEIESLLSLGDDEREGASPARSLSGYKLVLKNSFSLDLPTPINIANCKCPDVLIVDDNAFNILVLKSLIEKLGLRCATAVNGQDAVEKMGELSRCENRCGKLRGVFMDCEMPVMNGLEATVELVRLMRAGKIDDVPIIACTAFKGEEQRDACFEAGMSAYLTKPVMFSELKSTLMNFGIIDLMEVPDGIQIVLFLIVDIQLL